MLLIPPSVSRTGEQKWWWFAWKGAQKLHLGVLDHWCLLSHGGHVAQGTCSGVLETLTQLENQEDTVLLRFGSRTFAAVPPEAAAEQEKQWTQVTTGKT